MPTLACATPAPRSGTVQASDHHQPPPRPRSRTSGHQPSAFTPMARHCGRVAGPEHRDAPSAQDRRSPDGGRGQNSWTYQQGWVGVSSALGFTCVSSRPRAAGAPVCPSISWRSASAASGPPAGARIRSRPDASPSQPSNRALAPFGSSRRPAILSVSLVSNSIVTRGPLGCIASDSGGVAAGSRHGSSVIFSGAKLVALGVVG